MIRNLIKNLAVYISILWVLVKFCVFVFEFGVSKMASQIFKKIKDFKALFNYFLMFLILNRFLVFFANRIVFND